ncbi:MAG: hypothetical protein JJT88_16845 [Gammaproteobacteria bacterium]|nr:hypothetical protein [Gammaproteobacteria bacterium]
MSITVIIIIAFTIALVVGPLMWLRPTPRDRQLERLRGHARKRGLNISIREIPDPDPRPQDRVSSGGKVLQPSLNVALYQLPLRLPGRVEGRHAPDWEVIRLRHDVRSDVEDEVSAGLLSGWRFSRPGLPLIEGVVGRLSELLAGAPRGTAKVEGDASTVGLYWHERGAEAEVDAIADLLEALRLLQIEVSEAAAREEALQRRLAEDPEA